MLSETLCCVVCCMLKVSFCRFCSLNAVVLFLVCVSSSRITCAELIASVHPFCFSYSVIKFIPFVKFYVTFCVVSGSWEFEVAEFAARLGKQYNSLLILSKCIVLFAMH